MNYIGTLGFCRFSSTPARAFGANCSRLSGSIAGPLDHTESPHDAVEATLVARRPRQQHLLENRVVDLHLVEVVLQVLLSGSIALYSAGLDSVARTCACALSTGVVIECPASSEVTTTVTQMRADGKDRRLRGTEADAAKIEAWQLDGSTVDAQARNDRPIGERS
ncbi:hypothetical protein O4106_20685 [Rhodococcus pyridinivorans]|nr:hypothetical protein [Rhodococcus pyridinivorans]MCD2119117.1 hypothetical protein [Rhodococcus pyridinivorans]MCZ4628002.1 hypothetical protein [Rhodococcus pyridinivorans]MCZ4649246.1 hypothetical protein [Rhodococcus pyridinivorans]MDJ0483434.1 hypothetical protein [Rhodococcus pyridinivorans]MDV7255317.1 hypothetical protein [Rhodococcus pyridinivorans]